MTNLENIALPRSTPESQSVTSASILSLMDDIRSNGIDLHSFMALRHGNVIAEGWWNPYSSTTPHSLYSLTKSFTSTAIGLAVTYGLLTLDDTVVSFFPDKLPAEPDKRLASMTVRHLLTMSTGQSEDIVGINFDRNSDVVRAALSTSFVNDPGSTFSYTSTASYLLGAIIHRITGLSLNQYLQPRIFEPLGIDNVIWDECPNGVSIGGWGLSLRTEDIARFGQLYLQCGFWNGKQLIPKEWIELATSRQIDNGDDVDNDWNQGYCFQFWRNRFSSYRGDGAFGQYCVILPEHDVVVAITSGVGDMQGVLNLLWNRLLPGFTNETVIDQPEKTELLTSRLSTLESSSPEGKSQSPLTAQWCSKVFHFEQSPEMFSSITWDFRQPDSCTMTFIGVYGDGQISSRSDLWTDSNLTGFMKIPGKVFSRHAWTDQNTWHLRLRLVDTPYTFEVFAKFDSEGSVTVDIHINVWFGPTTFGPLIGKCTTT